MIPNVQESLDRKDSTLKSETMMNLVKSKKSGFTLIEMLVVIAIIALLAAILVPTVTNALENANRTRVLSNGRGIYQAIFAAHLETINFPPPIPVWPRDRAMEQNSTEYFRRLLDNRDSNNQPIEPVLSRDFALFAANGFPPVREFQDFAAGNNVWIVTAQANNSSTSQLPFLMTRNLEGDRLVEGTGVAPASGDPYDDRAIVVVRVGGGGEVIPSRALRWNNVNPAGADNQLLRPDLSQ